MLKASGRIFRMFVLFHGNQHFFNAVFVDYGLQLVQTPQAGQTPFEQAASGTAVDIPDELKAFGSGRGFQLFKNAQSGRPAANEQGRESDFPALHLPDAGSGNEHAAGEGQTNMQGPQHQERAVIIAVV